MKRKSRRVAPDPAEPARLASLRDVLASTDRTGVAAACVDAKPAVFAEALTHPSLASQRGIASNQRLELLGDSFVNAVATALVFERLSVADEGALTRARWSLVRTESLAELARTIGLGGLLATGLGAPPELATLENVLADTFEAVVGALFVAGGFDAARAFVLPLLVRRLDRTGTSDGEDPKSRLQIWTQAAAGVAPTYVAESVEGPEHAVRHVVTARVGERVVGRGQGASRRAAEQVAAEEALASFDEWIPAVSAATRPAGRA